MANRRGSAYITAAALQPKETFRTKEKEFGKEERIKSNYQSTTKLKFLSWTSEKFCKVSIPVTNKNTLRT